MKSRRACKRQARLPAFHILPENRFFCKKYASPIFPLVAKNTVNCYTFDMYKNLMNHKIIFMMLIMSIFLIVSLVAAALSVNIYEIASANTSKQKLTDASQSIASEIRKSDGSAIRTASVGGDTPALVMTTYRNGESVEIWLYADDGILKKAVVEKGTAVKKNKSKNIVALTYADFVMLADDLLEIRLTSEDDTCITNLFLPHYEGGI